jgi:hypothetical protein
MEVMMMQLQTGGGKKEPERKRKICDLGWVSAVVVL